MAEADTPVVEVWYNGMFINKPPIYFDPDKKEIMYADFMEMGYAKFIAHLNVITRRMCKDVYYCLDGQTWCQGLAALHNECDYHEFHECLHEKKKVNVYVDHMHEPLFDDWIEMEEPEIKDDTNSKADEDVDSMLIDKDCWEHEVDDEDFSMKRATTTIQNKDRFLNKLCPNVEEEEDSNVEQLPLIYPVHNFEQQWDEMAPVLGELLAAMGRDANNSMFPLAWVVVTVENKDTWKWFLDLLMDQRQWKWAYSYIRWTQAIKERVPHAEHRLCARHILANFNTRFKGEHFIKPFWRAVKATTKQRHEAAMQEIKELDRGHLIISWRGTLNVIAGLFK
ncbi:unnamed protein product [Lactuca saligna]|uniref:MULE transposase domain-containing protein n=1 Tax=Lactuca saligna TaxID=75948 RepID=A0AA35ULV4_LACSI|nr:unnamed protein product [Lactuca saligna]